jgi:filamentous hemagglutinin family protein
VGVEIYRCGKAKGKRQKARGKRLLTILHFVIYLGFFMPTYLLIIKCLKILISDFPIPSSKRGWRVIYVLYFLVFTSLSTQKTSAQLTPDTTLGSENSVTTQTVNSNGMNIDRIDGGAIRGTNLFHSFQNFNVDQGKGVYFAQPTGIARIITRVTGSQPSQILGTLGVLGNADLFMINPHGIIFGENSSLDIRGSFIGSTANSIKFKDGIQFSATNIDTKPLLTINMPLGLQFNSGNGSITSLSKPGLRVASGYTLALVGGDINLQASRTSSVDGRIELGSVGDNSLVILKPLTLGWQLDYQGIENFKDINLSQGSTISVRHTPNSIDNDVNVVVIQGKNLTFSDGAFIFAQNTNPSNTPNIFIKTSDSIKLLGISSTNSLGSGLYNQTSSDNNAGNITLETQKLIVQDGGVVSTGTTGNGGAGDIIINTSDSVQVTGSHPDPRFGSGIFSDSSGVNKNGSSGNVTINTKRLIVENGGDITTSTRTSGKAGDLSVNAEESIQLIGISSNSTGLFANSVAANNPGIGGNLNVTTKQLSISKGAAITVSSLGQAGNLTVIADNLSMDGGRLTANTSASENGEGANIQLDVKNLLLMRNESLISAKASGLADGGNININTKNGFVVAFSAENSDITANAEKGNGGNINITTQGIFGLEFRPQNTQFSDITASSQFGLAGQVQINTPDIDPISGLIELPGNLVDAESLVGKDICSSEQIAKNSSFTITGKGGLPAEAEDLISNSPGLVEWLSREEKQEIIPAFRQQQTKISDQAEGNQPVIQEAQGWIITSDGKVILTAESPKIMVQNSSLNYPGCHRGI